MKLFQVLPRWGEDNDRAYIVWQTYDVARAKGVKKQRNLAINIGPYRLVIAFSSKNRVQRRVKLKT